LLQLIAGPSATMIAMNKNSCLTLLLAVALFPARQQNAGSIEFVARVTPTAARPEPIRQFTFYVLTKSYSEIAREIELQDKLPARGAFIDTLKVSPELRAWLKAHELMDLTSPDVDKVISPDDIIQIPEFLLAYQRSNGGGVTSGMPKPKYSDSERTLNPERYEKQRQEYLTALKKFIVTRPETVSGIELELDGVNPQRLWAKLETDQRKRVQRMAPEVAQTKYLAAKADTDLEGRAAISGLRAGNYWISSLNLDANAGDQRLRWDVPVELSAGQTARIELTNLNAIDARAASNP
jgi:hypothetical protein